MGASRKLEPVETEELVAQWAQEVERARALVHDLRNPIGAIALATELLQGPLGKVQTSLERKDAQNLRTILEALSCAVEQAVHLVQAEHAQPRADLHLVSVPTEAPPAPKAKGPTPAKPAKKAPKKGVVDVVAMLRKLEILIVTRSSLPALLAVQCSTPLWLSAQGAELMRVLSNLVENGIEASARAKPTHGPWTVNLSCELLEDGACQFVVENEGDAPGPELFAWLADANPKMGSAPKSSKPDANLHGVGLSSVRAIIEAHEGQLRAEHKNGRTRFMAWIPASRVRQTALTA